MGFGNPYGDSYSESVVQNWIEKIVALGVETISLADTVGVAKPAAVRSPADGANNVASPVNFIWSPVTGAIKYVLVARVNDGAPTPLAASPSA